LPKLLVFCSARNLREALKDASISCILQYRGELEIMILFSRSSYLPRILQPFYMPETSTNLVPEQPKLTSSSLGKTSIRALP
jgi:hypothetical protein